jgi:putative hydrolase of HD superfamily
MDRDIEFLYEIGTLRLTQRQWKRFLNPDFANLADHHLRVIWIALTIAKYEKADANKVMKMALVHDIAESRTGDVDYLSRQYVERNSELGLEDMVKDISLEKELLDLQKEYEERKTLEAKIVKDADNLDIDLYKNSTAYLEVYTEIEPP